MQLSYIIYQDLRRRLPVIVLLAQRIEGPLQRAGNEGFPLVNARLTFTLNALNSENEQNALVL